MFLFKRMFSGFVRGFFLLLPGQRGDFLLCSNFLMAKWENNPNIALVRATTEFLWDWSLINHMKFLNEIQTFLYISHIISNFMYFQFINASFIQSERVIFNKIFP